MRGAPARAPARRAATAAAVVAAALWGTTGTVQALGPEASPLAYGALRLLVGGLGLVLLSTPRGRSGRQRRGVAAGPASRRRGLALLVGVVGVAAYQLCFFAAVRGAGVAVGTVVGIGSAPPLTGLLGWLVLGERPDRRWAGATALAVSGVAVLLLPGRQSAVAPSGILLALGAGLAYATYALSSKALLETGLDRRTVMAALFGVAALLLSPLVLLIDLSPFASLRGVVALGWLGLAATTLAYDLFARALTHLSAAAVATLSLAEPLTAALLGVAVLGERASAPAVLGAGCVLAGLALIIRPAAVGDG